MTINPDLQRERQRATFNPRQLTYILHGGEEETLRREYIFSLLDNDPDFRTDDRYYLDQHGLYLNALRKDVKAIKLVKELNLNEKDVQNLVAALNQQSPIFGLHNSMFIPTIKGQGTKEQQDYWLPLAENYKVIGTYAQTELGHGTYIQGIETTATLDFSTDEWIINSPTLTSTKFWPGSLGKTCTHAVVMAQLIIGDKIYGVHPFVVQLRSLEDHTSLPGIQLGDIGPKFGFNTIDNGFARFSNIRIPRENMLMRFASVDKNGNYSRPLHAKISYLTMMKVRSGLVLSGGHYLSSAVTIAIRYSAVRHQGYLFGEADTNPERAVIDFQMQRYRLFPLVASAYAFWFIGLQLVDQFNNLEKRVQDNDVSLLPEMHATVSCLKAYTTWECADGIEECRKACGGHGYLRVSGLPDIFARYVPSCTFEGDNYVLIQQTARYQLKCLKQFKLHPLTNFGIDFDYILHSDRWLHEKCGVIDPMVWLDIRAQVDVLKHRAIRLVVELSDHLSHLISSGRSESEAWNLAQPLFIRTTRAHAYLMLTRNFYGNAEKIEDKNIRTVMIKLQQLFTLTHIEKHLADFLEDGFMTGMHGNQIRAVQSQLLLELRPNIVALVDAFNIPDSKMYYSALGRYDGQVYKALFESTARDARNQTDVTPAYDAHLKSLLKSNL